MSINTTVNSTVNTITEPSWVPEVSELVERNHIAKFVPIDSIDLTLVVVPARGRICDERELGGGIVVVFDHLADHGRMGRERPTLMLTAIVDEGDGALVFEWRPLSRGWVSIRWPIQTK